MVLLCFASAVAFATGVRAGILFLQPLGRAFGGTIGGTIGGRHGSGEAGRLLMAAAVMWFSCV